MNKIINNKEFLMSLVSEEVKFDLTSKKVKLVNDITNIINTKCNNNKAFFPEIIDDEQESNYSILNNDIVEKYLPLDRILIKNTNDILTDPLYNFLVDLTAVNKGYDLLDTLIGNLITLQWEFGQKYSKLLENNIIAEIDLLDMTVYTANNNDRLMMIKDLGVLTESITQAADIIYNEINNIKFYQSKKRKMFAKCLDDFNNYETFFRTFFNNVCKENEELLDFSMTLFNENLKLGKSFKRSVVSE